MVGSGSFETLAQFAIAQAGFASVVVVLRRGRDQFHPADGFRVFNALVPSILAGFLALVPLGLAELGVPEARIWTWVSILFAVVVGSLSIQIFRGLQRLPPGARAIISSLIVRAHFTILGLTVAVCLANGTTSLLGPVQGGFYFFGILALLWVGAVAFVRLVFIRPPA